MDCRKNGLQKKWIEEKMRNYYYQEIYEENMNGNIRTIYK